MAYDENPSKEVLDKIQLILDKENEDTNHLVGIVDIWMPCTCDTNHSVGIVDILMPCTCNGWYCVVMNDDNPIAVASVYKWGELYKLYVCPESRGKGIAEQLVLHIIKKNEYLETDGLFVEMTQESINFWDKVIKKNKLRFIQYEHDHSKISLWLK
ncbi:GNAT family N-acetyltransferase [Xenorhabdus stockiae]|uniref:GNAT family N-acetyltransferase n=1 Tax=Xenorhabdus stockiae TaxID=351614 RepID=UPI0040635B0A